MEWVLSVCNLWENVEDEEHFHAHLYAWQCEACPIGFSNIRKLKSHVGTMHEEKDKFQWIGL